MRIAIMQPYFLPYVGYFQLMAAVDRFVVLDDVNFIKGGWINRNRILVNGNPKWLTIPLSKPSPNRLLSDIETSVDPKWRRNILNACANAYRHSQHYDQGMSLLSNILDAETRNASQFITSSLQTIAACLELNSEFIPSSSAYPKNGRRGSDRVIDICCHEDADDYLNLPGGRELYDREEFARSGIRLLFLDPVLEPYFQGSEAFVPCMSIIDMFMHLSTKDVAAHVRRFCLTES